MLKRFIAIICFAAVSLCALLCVPAEPADVPEESCEAEAEAVRLISDYDEAMRLAEQESGIDWRLLSAIAHTESRFKADIVSPRGAVGLMQILPSVGRHYGVSDQMLAEPRMNVWVAAMLLREIESIMGLPDSLAPADRWGIILACYNGGVGHVSDARRLAQAYGEDRDSWQSVSKYLKLKSQPEYYEHEAVSCGCFNGGRRTSAYVRDVMKCYERYCRQTASQTAAQSALQKASQAE